MAVYTFTTAAFYTDRTSENAIWATARSATTGTSTGRYTGAELVGGNYKIYRSFMSVSTASIPDTDTIISGTLTIAFGAKDTTNDFVVALTGHTSDSDITLADADFNNITLNSPTEYATRTNNVSTYANPENHTFTLNTNGLGAISKTGYTKFCLRSSKDVDNSTPNNRSFLALGATFTLTITTTGGNFFAIL